MELPENLATVYTMGRNFYKSMRGQVAVLNMKDPQSSKDKAVVKISRSKIARSKFDSDIPEHNEARLLSTISHFNIIKMLTWESNDSRDFLVLERMTGSLRGFQLFKGGIFEADEAYVYLRQMADALDYLHLIELVHRDVKSENILIDLEHDWQGSYLLKLCDFQISLYLKEIDKDPQLRGTLDFVSPELVERGKVTSACDVWALGVTYYDWIIGNPPFQKLGAKETYAAIVENEPDYSQCTEEQTFLLKLMLEKDPRERITAPLLNIMINHAKTMEISGGDVLEPRKLITTFEWYTRNQKYETHIFSEFEDIWKICQLEDCEEEDFELTKEGFVSFRSDEWIKFPENSGHLNEQFLIYCQEKAASIQDNNLVLRSPFTLTSTHHWSDGGKISADVYRDRISFFVEGVEKELSVEDYVRCLITFLGCLFFQPDVRLLRSDLHLNDENCSLQQTREILEIIYSMPFPFDLELLYGCKESVLAKQTEYEPVKPKTIEELLKVVGFKTNFKKLPGFDYYEYPDSVIFQMVPFDEELRKHFNLESVRPNAFLVYYDR